MSCISTYCKIGSEQVDNIKKAVEILVGIAVGKLRTDPLPEERRELR
jgi:hypothetical protein